MALNGSVIRCTLSASLALACGVSTTSPSTPAVSRPALRSVTRRTLISVFARERSINFCRLRTLFRSPAFDAVKIRCRSRRTSSSARRQSTWRQSKGASSGPFTTPTVAVAVSNLSSGSGGLAIFLSTGSPDRVSALLRPGTRPGYPAGYPRRPPGGGRHRVPVSRRVSAAGIRFSVILFPPGSWAPLAVGLPDETCRPDPDGVTAFRTHELRPGWVPPLPRGRRCSPGHVVSLTGACRSSAASPLYPASTSHRRGLLDEASTRIHAIHPAGLPLARSRPDGTGHRFGFPSGFAPRRPGADDARRGGDRPTSTDLELRAQHHIG
jgi:hypothetical protein